MKYAVWLILVLAAPMYACIHVDVGFEGKLNQAAQRVIVLHRAPSGDTPGYQEMLIRVQPQFEGGAPAHAAWVITVPSTPLRYDVADKLALDAGPALHHKLYTLARQQWRDRTDFGWPDWLSIPKLSSRAASDPQMLVDVAGAVSVGPYTITPVRARGADAAAALNQYLRERGYAQVADSELTYFIKHDFTFLCVRIEPPQGSTTLGGVLDLPPLVVGFETAEPYYPARFSAGQGNFALDLTVITDRPLSLDSLSSARERLNADARGYVELVNLYSIMQVPDVLATVLGERVLAPTDRWYVNRIQSDGFNQSADGKPAIAAWEDDVFFKVGDNRDELPGFWYYADNDITWYERFFREHALAMFVAFGVFFFGSLYIKTRINRKRLKAAK